jgi:LysM repeat protein
VRGDTLTSIAKKFNTTVAKLVDINNIPNPDLIIAGKTLKVPA